MGRESFAPGFFGLREMVESNLATVTSSSLLFGALILPSHAPPHGSGSCTESRIFFVGSASNAL